METLNYNENCWKKECPKVDCKKNKCHCGLKHIVIPADLGDDSKDSPVAPKNGDYCNAIVIYQANKHTYIYSEEGVYTLIDVDAIDVAELEALTKKAIQDVEDLSDNINEFIYGFDTVSHMKMGSNFSSGRILKVIGEEKYDDGKQHYYRVRDKKIDDVIDEDDLVSLTNYPNLVAERIKNYYIDYNLEFYSIEKASSGFIIKLPNGKIFLYDTGKASQWTDVKNALDSLNITKIDYIALSHFHDDHIGNIANICSYYNVSECTCWIGMKPDYANHAEQMAETEEYYNGCITLLRNNGLDPIVPTNDSYVEIDENVKIHFLNTSLELAEEYSYYTQQPEWQDTGKANLNLFSLICEVMYNANTITLTGDLEKAAEEANTNNIHPSTILVMPHHGINRNAYKPFYLAANPEYVILQYVANKGNSGWIYAYYQGYKIIQEIGSSLIAPAWTYSIDGLYQFFLSEYSAFTIVSGLNQPEDKLLHIGERFGQVPYFIDYSKATASTVTLNDIISNMKRGDVLSLYWYSTFSAIYPALYNDLVGICPKFSSDCKIQIEKIGESTLAKIVINTTYNLEFVYTLNSTDNVLTKIGRGIIPSKNSTSALIEELKLLPVGTYQCSFFSDTANIDANEYILSIELVETDNVDIKASAVAVNRSTDPSRVVVTRSCYINTQLTPQFSWK